MASHSSELYIWYHREPQGRGLPSHGAYLNAVSNAQVGIWEIICVFVDTPMFHCNGWCFPWTLAANAGASVCLRQVRDDAVYQAMGDHKVTLLRRPVVLNTLLAASDELKPWYNIRSKL